MSIEITHLNSMGVAVGISLISGAVHEICHLLHFPGPPSCFPGPGRQCMMSAILFILFIYLFKTLQTHRD